MNGYQEDIARLGPLAPVALALIEYAKALVPGGEFVRKKAWWVSEPDFVAFKVPKRSRQVIFSLYGFSTSFKKCPALSIYWSRGSYSEFRLDSPRQLGAAASYIVTSFHRAKFKRKRSKAEPPELHEIL
jgi:hypothetical protein